jgi:hypothetical protein
MKVVILATACDDVYFSVDRVSQRNSLLVAIVADGTFLKPLMILPRKTIETELYEQGITADVCMFVHQTNGFIATELFRDWYSEVLLSEILKRRERLNYWRADFVTFDSLSCHGSDEVLWK